MCMKRHLVATHVSTKFIIGTKRCPLRILWVHMDLRQHLPNYLNHKPRNRKSVKVRFMFISEEIICSFVFWIWLLFWIKSEKVIRTLKCRQHRAAYNWTPASPSLSCMHLCWFVFSALSRRCGWDFPFVYGSTYSGLQLGKSRNWVYFPPGFLWSLQLPVVHPLPSPFTPACTPTHPHPHFLPVPTFLLLIDNSLFLLALPNFILTSKVKVTEYFLNLFFLYDQLMFSCVQLQFVWSCRF